MDSRRNFIGKVASGIAGTLASPGRVLGANDRIRLGIIGPGTRGVELVREVLACPDTEVAAFADIYKGRHEEMQNVVPGAKAHWDYRALLDDKSIDAVIIATPQHLHCEHFVASLNAGKHVYQEKTLAFTLEQAKRMRAAYQQAGKRVVQVGHQSCSSGQMKDAQTFLASGKVGKVTAIQAYMYRNTPHGKPQWARLIHPEMTTENIAWDQFLGESRKVEFDPNRYANWRFFWDYSGGNVYENMCHQLSFWYKAMNLQIPRQVTMLGGVYLWKDGREVPDTMNVTMEHPEEILFSWSSGFGNNQLGTGEDVLGTDGTITRTQQIRYVPQKVNEREAPEALGRTNTPRNAHAQNFLDCIRDGKEPNCPFDVGFRVSVACRMAVDSYLQGRTMKWDPRKEELV